MKVGQVKIITNMGLNTILHHVPLSHLHVKYKSQCFVNIL